MPAKTERYDHRTEAYVKLPQKLDSFVSSMPNLEEQAGIWKLLKQLTAGFMMDAKAIVSASVFHHLELIS